MNQERRKAASNAYRERKVAAGIYAVRCAASGECWVGQAPDLSTIQNRIWFTLRFGGNRQASLQEAWNRHGADAFTFEVVETIEEEDEALFRDRVLKERRAHWATALGAKPI
ncbi:hypothetical protein BN1110_05184 [bacterium YEK0313]|nr:hypothetical protein BN1110_05184 [bacterium YEK0313]